MIQKTKERCSVCMLQIPVCMCRLVPSITTQTKLTLIIHAHEVNRPTNTGSLAVRCLTNSAMHIRGKLGGAPIDTSGFLSDDRTTFVLFPDEGAVDLDAAFVSSLKKPVNLIVPDGNWRQASSIPRRETILRDLPRLRLPFASPSEYRLRRKPKQRDDGLATMEAIARAFAVLEGQDVYEQLMDIFRIKVSRSLWIRGTIRGEDVYGGLPRVQATEPA